MELLFKNPTKRGSLGSAAIQGNVSYISVLPFFQEVQDNLQAQVLLTATHSGMSLLETTAAPEWPVGFVAEQGPGLGLLHS